MKDVAAGGVDQTAGSVVREGPRPGVVLLYSVAQDEEPVSLKGQVRLPSGGLQGALSKDRVHAADGHSRSELYRIRGGTAILSACADVHRVRQQRLEVRAAVLEPERIHVGKVVADHGHPSLMALETGDSAGNCSHHFETLLRFSGMS